MTLAYDLGEMKGRDGSALRYEVEAVAADFARRISDVIKEQPAYKKIKEVLRSPKTLLYFQKVIKTEIYPAVRDYCVIDWYRRNQNSMRPEDGVIQVPDSGIFRTLEEVMADKGIRFRFMRDASNNCLKELAKKMVNLYLSRGQSRQRRHAHPEKPMIALQYAEGFDLDRRSDIIWCQKSNIEPSRILIYFDGQKPVTDDLLEKVKELGMRAVILKRGFIRNNNIRLKRLARKADFWHPSRSAIERFEKMLVIDPKNKLEEWILQNAKVLLRQVGYWRSFYDDFNIKLNFIIGEGQAIYLARSIAFELNTPPDGFLVSKQRSELFWPSGVLPAHYPADVFFTWNKRSQSYLNENIGCAQANITVGYPNDYFFIEKFERAKELRAALSAKGVRFTIALFDNVFGPHLQYSTNMMESFYRVFLTWLLEDRSLGLIIKSKKPEVLDGLTAVQPLLEKAEATGRCIRLKNERGRPPIDAAAASDIAVGIGISSAVIESLIAGCRGILCDLTGFRSHEYYKWGYERLIFDDLNRMIAALKVYKTNNASVPGLGDWSKFLNELDPFHDGRARERMGDFMRFLLDGFDQGMPSVLVLESARQAFTNKWGKPLVGVINHART